MKICPKASSATVPAAKTSVPLVLAAIATLFLAALYAQPTISGKISGGFQAPSSTDADGRRHVIKGKDMEPRANNIIELTEPRVTRYNPDDTPDMVIESPRCFYNTKATVASSPSSLSVRTADSRFSLEGVGWHWDLSGSVLTISNKVTAIVQKAVLSRLNAKTNVLKSPTNQPVQINAARFQQDGDAASFLGGVTVKDGEDTLTCERLNIQFIKPGGAQKIEAIQNVDLVQASNRIQSGRAVYDVKENIIRLSERPTWFLDHREGSADLLVFNRSNNTLFAEGSVYMKLPLTNALALGGSVRTNQPATNQVAEIRSQRFEYLAASSNRTARATYLGNVEASQVDAKLLCQQLTVDFAASNRLTHLNAERDVQIESGRNRAFGQRAEYDLQNEKIIIQGDPRWQIGETKGRSETLILFTKTKEVLAQKNVEMLLPAGAAAGIFSMGASNRISTTNSPMKVTAGTLSYSENVSVFQDSVRIADSHGTIECALMTVTTGASNQVQRILGEGGVAIKMPDLVALGDRADYDQTTGLVRLTGNPELIAPGKELRADAFIIDRNRHTFSVSPGKYRIRLQMDKKMKLK